ncbi:intermediate conductance calcium-activated potassium channel protein 4 isoform X1 [Pungitius pungitius]|uniref:intermediate conductance calcium-activated potassium channel protein 4 isoform X1 n=1 Tax=Pungitius pungitius TaxID=134920 RepID=UPI001886D9B4|nr:intermediate conductance calcium-activated potassium channel protein 4 isoform X1 [Pungitius pungitius]
MASKTQDGSKGDTEPTRDGETDSNVVKTGSGVCTLEMEMNRSLVSDSKQNPGEVSVPLSLLRDRKLLLEDRKRLCALSLGTALLGILLMIIYYEICPYMYQPGTNTALFINCSISLSTGCLLIFIILFHHKDIMLFVIDQKQVDWRIAMSSHRVLVITVELLVCVIHPVGSYWEGGLHADSSSSPPLCIYKNQGGPLMNMELLLSVLMFLRLYLVHRAILLHSKVLLSPSYRSIGSLNNTNFNFRFVVKILMIKYPARTLLVFILFFWVTASWMLTLCERQYQATTGHMHTAMWLIAVTFLTVGYGDVVPNTSYGKAVCLFTGVTLKRGKQGVACTAMLVAVVTKMLTLNKGEKHLHFFMLDTQISNTVRHAAANVLRECWLLRRTKPGQPKGNRADHRRHQRCLLDAITVFRHQRLKQKMLNDRVSEMKELPKMQMTICNLSDNWNNSYKELQQRILSMEQKLDELSRCFQQTSELLSQVLCPRNPESR